MPQTVQKAPTTKRTTHVPATSAPIQRNSIFSKYVGTLHVSPQQQLQLSLGYFGVDNPGKGFSVELEPDPEPLGSVVTEILSVGSTKQHELILNVANYGQRAVSAKVWQM